MKKIAGYTLGAMAIGLGAYSNAGAEPPAIVAGVDMNKVNWPALCASVAPVTVTRGGVTCNNVYPTSSVVPAYYDATGLRPDAPPLNCDRLGLEFKKMTTPKLSADPWSDCRVEFTLDLQMRAGKSATLKYKDMTFEAWRDKYFKDAIVIKGGAK